MKYDLIIVGAGPAGIFTAIELLKLRSEKKILMIERVSLLKNVIVPKLKHSGVCTANLIVISQPDFRGGSAFRRQAVSFI